MGREYLEIFSFLIFIKPIFLKKIVIYKSTFKVKKLKHRFGNFFSRHLLLPFVLQGEEKNGFD